MQVVLEIQSGTQAGKRVELRSPAKLTVGRTTPAEFIVPDDTRLSSLHFSLEVTPDECILRDLNSQFGTFVGGRPSPRLVLGDGEVITAGDTRFLVRFQAASAEPVSPAPAETSASSVRLVAKLPPHIDRVFTLLRKETEPLFALLDAARDAFVVRLLEASKEEFQSLYEGPQGEEMAEFGPYLVRLPSASPLLGQLVELSWGRSWGVYLTSREPFKEVRKHFRRFLLAKLPEGEEVYFRFYDPRVLRVFLPTCTPQETTQFFGPVGAYILEDKQALRLLKFTPDRGATREAVDVAAG